MKSKTKCNEQLVSKMLHTQLHIDLSKDVHVIQRHISLLFFTLIQPRYGKSHKISKYVWRLMTNKRYFYDICMLLESNLCHGKWGWNPPNMSLTQVYFGGNDSTKLGNNITLYNTYEKHIHKQTEQYHNISTRYPKTINKLIVLNII